MTTSVGQVLQRARTQRGIDLTEVERVTKIRLKFLRAMEEDRWDELPEPVYARSFLESYARYLDLDPKPLLDDYEKTAAPDHSERIPLGAIRPGGARPDGRGRRRFLLIGAGFVAAALVVLIVVAVVGGSGGGDTSGRPARKSSPPASTTVAEQPAPSSRVSLDLHSTDAVWVCLIGDDNQTLVAETLSPGETRGPFDARSFDVTFGNGSVEMTVDGEAAKVPPLAEPLGYRITPRGIHRLDSTSEPTCT